MKKTFRIFIVKVLIELTESTALMIISKPKKRRKLTESSFYSLSSMKWTKAYPKVLPVDTWMISKAVNKKSPCRRVLVTRRKI